MTFPGIMRIMGIMRIIGVMRIMRQEMMESLMRWFSSVEEVKCEVLCLSLRPSLLESPFLLCEYFNQGQGMA